MVAGIRCPAERQTRRHVDGIDTRVSTMQSGFEVITVRYIAGSGVTSLDAGQIRERSAEVYQAVGLADRIGVLLEPQCSCDRKVWGYLPLIIHVEAQTPNGDRHIR